MNPEEARNERTEWITPPPPGFIEVTQAERSGPMHIRADEIVAIGKADDGGTWIHTKSGLASPATCVIYKTIDGAGEILEKIKRSYPPPLMRIGFRPELLQ